MASRRRQILETIKARVALITIVGGFLTDAGKLVFLGEIPVLSPDDPDAALALVPEDDEVTEQTALGGGTGATVQIDLTIGIHGLVKADLDTPLIALEDVIQDIKKAVELDDCTLAGLAGALYRGSTRPLERVEGSDIVGASVDYRVIYPEAWGDPENIVV